MHIKKLLATLYLLNALLITPLYANQCIDQIAQHYDAIHKTLNLANCKITDKNIPAIVNFLSSTYVILNVDLSNNAIGAAGANTLASYKATLNLSFNLNNNPIGDAGAVSLAKSNACYLMLENTNITDVGASALAQSEGYGSLGLGLDLANNKITAKSLTDLAANPSINTLDVSHDNIGDIGLAILATSLSLQVLSVNKDNITNLDAIANAKANKISYLYAANNTITGKNIQQLINSGQCFNLIDLTHNQLGDIGISALAGMKCPSSFRTYQASNPIASVFTECNTNFQDNAICAGSNNITDKGIAAFAKDSQNYSTLSLENNHITDAGARVLAGIPTSTLNLAHNNITNLGLLYLANSHHSTALNLAHNQMIDDDGIKQAADMLNVTTFNVSYTNITDASMPYLLSNAKLSQLILSHNKGIHDAGAFLLSTSSSLHQLDVSYDSIGQDGVKALRQDKLLTYLNAHGQSQ